MQHRSPISSVAASVDGRYVATAGYDNQVVLWDAATRTPLARSAHDHLANQVVFNTAGTLLATASSDHTARLWAVPSMKLLAVMHDHQDDVEMVAFSPTSCRLATASRDGRVRIFGFDGGLHATFAGHLADVISVVWSADGHRLTSSSSDGTVRRWNADDASIDPEVIGRGDVGTDTIVLTRDGRAYAGNDVGSIVIIRENETVEMPAHSAGIKRLVLNPQETAMVSLSYDRTIKLWRLLADGGLEFVTEANFPSDVWANSASFLTDTTMVFGTFGTSYAEFDLSTGAWNTAHVCPTGGFNAVAEMGGHRFTVGDAGLVRRDGKLVHRLGSPANFITPVGTTAVSGGQTGQVFDLLTGQVVYQHRSPLNCGAAFDRDGVPHVVVGAYTGEGLIFRVDSASDQADTAGADTSGSAPPAARISLVQIVQLHFNAVKGLASDGETIFSVCMTGAAAWHRTSDFGHVATRSDAHDKIANACATAAAGTYVSVSRDLKLRIWRHGTSQVVSTSHTHSIKSVAVSSDGRFVATGSYNGRICVYDRVAATWHVSRPTTHGISSLTWSVTGNCFLGSSYDGNVFSTDPLATYQKTAAAASIGAARFPGARREPGGVMRIAVAVCAIDGLQSIFTGVGVVVQSFVDNAESIASMAVNSAGLAARDVTTTVSCATGLLVDGATELRPELRAATVDLCTRTGGDWVQFPSLVDGRVAARLFTGPDLATADQQWTLLSEAAADWLLRLAADHDVVLAILHDTPFACVGAALSRRGAADPERPDRRVHLTWLPHSLGLVFPDKMAVAKIGFERAGIEALVERGDRIGYVSEFYRQTLSEQGGVPHDYLLPFLNVFDTSAARYRQPPSPAARAVLAGLPAEGRLILSWGRCKPQKGFDEILRAFRLLLDREGARGGVDQDGRATPDALGTGRDHLVLVAPTATTEPSYLELVRELLADLPADRVSVSFDFDESLPFAVLGDPRLRAVVLGSRFEAFGLVAAEATALAHPDARILYSPIPPFTAQLRDDPRAVRLAAVDAEAIAAALEEPGPSAARPPPRPRTAGPPNHAGAATSAQTPVAEFVRVQAAGLAARLRLALTVGVR